MVRGKDRCKNPRFETELEYNLRRNEEQKIRRAKARIRKEKEDDIEELECDDSEEFSEVISKYHVLKMDEF